MNEGALFRVRRVGEWLGQDTTEDVEKTGGLSEGRGRVVTLNEQVAPFYSKSTLTLHLIEHRVM
jgi:hypothetical protein